MNESWRWMHSLQTEAQERDADWSQLDHIADCVAAMPHSQVWLMPHQSVFPYSWSKTGA